jgi:phytoene dehydrogenase-like protein
MRELVIVVGGGLGGLSAAIHLASGCRQVTILEQAPQLGGKMSELRQAGYRWDTGPTVITLRPVLEALFETAGRRLDDYLTLVPIDPLTRYHYPDGTVFDVHASLAATIANVGALPGGTPGDGRSPDVSGYLSFLAYAAQMYRVTDRGDKAEGSGCDDCRRILGG